MKLFVPFLEEFYLGGNMSTPLDYIVEEQKQKLKNALPKAAKEIGHALGAKFISTVSEFYNQYDPRIYKRTYGVYDFGYGVGGKRRYVQKSGDRYSCGLRVDPSFMSGNPYAKSHGWTDISPSDIYYISFVGGLHGYDADVLAPVQEKYVLHNAPPVMSPSPMEVMDDFFDEYTVDRVVGIIESYMG